MQKVSTIHEVAAALGVDKSTISRDAVAANLGKFIGNIKIFTPQEVRKLKEIRGKKRVAGNTGKKVWK